MSSSLHQLMLLMLEFLREVETLIEEDDGTVFQMRHIEEHEELIDRLKEEGYE